MIQEVFCALALGLALCPALAAAQETLPDIEIRRLDLYVEKTSTNGRVIQFTAEGAPPGARKLILIKERGLPQIALRVIKLFSAEDLGPNSSRFAAQWVRTYDFSFQMRIGASYKGILKLRDIELEALDKDVADGKENEPAAPELEPTPPEESPPPEEEKSAQQLTEEEERELKALAYEEPPNLEPERDALSFVAGGYRLPEYSGGAMYLRAAGLRYSRTFLLPVWKNFRKLQDSLSADVTAVFGKRLEYAEAGDSYTVMPLLVSMRYNWNLSESIGIFAQTGLMKPWVVSSVTSGTDEGLAAEILGQFQFGLGIGALWRLGPQWFGRIDLGVEQLSGGITLKF